LAGVRVEENPGNLSKRRLSMITVLELINALENQRGDYDDPVVLYWPVVGRREPVRFSIADVSYTAGGTDGNGEMEIIISRKRE
jgi:hypothetical protein